MSKPGQTHSTAPLVSDVKNTQSQKLHRWCLLLNFMPRIHIAHSNMHIIFRCQMKRIPNPKHYTGGTFSSTSTFIFGRACQCTVGHFYFLGAASQLYAKKQKNTNTTLDDEEYCSPPPSAVIAPLVDSQPHPTLSGRRRRAATATLPLPTPPALPTLPPPPPSWPLPPRCNRASAATAVPFISIVIVVAVFVVVSVLLVDC